MKMHVDDLNYFVVGITGYCEFDPLPINETLHVIASTEHHATIKAEMAVKEKYKNVNFKCTNAEVYKMKNIAEALNTNGILNMN